MPCPFCKAEVAPTDVYCISCGTRLIPVQQQETVVPGPSEPAPVPPTRHEEAAAFGAPRLPSPDSKPLSIETSIPGAPRPRRWPVLVIALLINMILLAASAWLVYAALVRYAERTQPAMSLGAPRLVRGAPRPAAAPDARVELRVAEPTPPAKGRPAGPAAGSSRTKKTAAAPAAPVHATAPAAPASRPSAATTKHTPKSTGSTEPASEAEQVRAGLDADSVRMVVQHHLPQVRTCYDRVLKQQDALSGVVEIQFEVGSDGRVRSASVYRNTTGHDGLGRCIATTLRGWRFPRPVGGDVVFIYPFLFSSGE
jgi:TonB family protein